MKNQRGITLVALVITIIILVILAAVSIAVINKMGIVEKSVEGTQNYADTARAENEMLNAVKSYMDVQANDIVSRIEREGKAPTFADVTEENIGEYVELGTSYVKGNSIQGGTAKADWRIFYTDSENGKIYLILADYLPVSSIPSSIRATLNTTDTKPYSVWVDEDRDTLYNALVSSAWVSLANGKSTEVYGSATGTDFERSYSAKHEAITYTSTPVVDTTDSLYLPHTSAVDGTRGYWLATKNGSYQMWGVSYMANGLASSDHDVTTMGIRPIVVLSTSRTASPNANGVWVVN